MIFLYIYYIKMLIYEKLGYNKIQARLIQLLLRDDNNNHSQDIEKPYLIGGSEGKNRKRKIYISKS